MSRYVAFVSRLSVVSRCACLLGVVALVFALVVPVAYGSRGVVGIQAVLFAAAVSLCGALIAVILASIRQGTPSAVAWVLAGDGIAMAVPLLSGYAVSRSGGSLAAAGVFNWIVLFFLVALATKTLLVAPLAQHSADVRRANQVAAKVGSVGSVSGDRSVATTELGAKITKAGA